MNLSNIYPLAAEKSRESEAIRLDRVTQILLAKGIITPADIGLLIERKTDNSPMWRLLIELDLVNADRVYRTAASAYGFEQRELLSSSVCERATELASKLSWSDWRALLDNGILPIGKNTTPAGRERIVFASYDPSRHAVHRILHGFKNLSFELVFAERLAVTSLIPLVEMAVKNQLTGVVTRAA